LVQLQNNRFGKNDFGNEAGKNKFVLFDYDEGNYRSFDVNKINGNKNVRTVDTRFEDSFN
jgi:hypothetical protein